MPLAYFINNSYYCAMRDSKLLISLIAPLFLIALLIAPAKALAAPNFVPYIGATGNVDLGIYNITANKVTSNTDATINSINVGLGGGSFSTNLALGSNALLSNTNGVRNVAIGSSALSSNAVASDNTAVGFVALGTSTNSGEQNTAVGSLALNSNINGSSNAALGYLALQLNTSGNGNVAVGNEALKSNDTAGGNVGIGFRSLTNNTSGTSNVAIGADSAERLTGAGNVAIGAGVALHQADGNTFLTAANNSVYIGDGVQGFDNNDNNSIVIGTGAIGTGSNKAVIGNSSMTDVYFGSSSANANAHAKKLFLGSPSTPGCIVMGDTAGGVGYVTLTSGVLTVSSTPPSACQ